MNELVRYEVIDKKGRWMGSYSAELEKRLTNKVRCSTLEMAKINARYSNAVVYAVYSDGTKTAVFGQQ